jgi:hypothetical protein
VPIGDKPPVLRSNHILTSHSGAMSFDCWIFSHFFGSHRIAASLGNCSLHPADSSPCPPISSQLISPHVFSAFFTHLIPSHVFSPFPSCSHLLSCHLSFSHLFSSPLSLSQIFTALLNFSQLSSAHVSLSYIF